MPNSPPLNVAALASTLVVGGAERQLASLARGLRDAGHRFSLFTLRAAGPVGEELAADGFAVAAGLLARPATVFRTLERVRGHDILLALDHNNVLRLLAFARRLPPYVVLYHAQGAPPRAWRRALARAYAVVTVAQSQRRFLEGVKDKVVAIPNGVVVPPAVTADARKGARRDLGLPPAALVAATAARLSPEKGVDLLLEALVRMDDARRPFVAVAGAGPARPQLERYAAANLPYGGYAFLGERPDVAPLLRAADLYVQPSRRESAPLAVLEAMAHGLPVVAAAVGDVPEMLADGCGLTFTPGAVDELAAALARVAADGRLREDLGARARARVEEQYNREDMLASYLRLLKDAAAAAGTRP